MTKPKADRITMFFSGPFDRCVRKGRYIIVFLFVVVGIFAAIIASDIGPLTKEEEYLPSDSPLMTLQKDVERNFFSTSALKDSLVVNLNWGINDLDRSDVSTWDVNDIGELIWDEELTVVPARNQQALLDLCTDLRDNRDDLVKDKFVTCWVTEMDAFV